MGAGVLGALGVVFGGRVQNTVSNSLGTGLGGILPFGDRFRYYSITGTYPKITKKKYRLEVSGLVDRPTTFTFDDLQALPATELTKAFQCVTGWRVPDVQWRGVLLADLLRHVGVQPNAVALSFESYDGADTESLTIDQANLPNVLVAYEMLGAPVTRAHGGPVRLFVAPMYGYKSLKWLSAIRVVDRVQPGYWEQNGYPVNGWIDGTTGPTNHNPQLA
ncbi:MAG: molybdopterin-dependent oxidoreductase [Acidobacteriota bacterium]|nr:molybdopterin-dependent oxidoreductase [Acidobacteriota bacterium]MDE3043255.1 molybdopterin-dependent oxidoreductase [Acidobacteriota bacterium]MDE3106577.1 molybdopterin-dependent oxidoreductase [Acidobacteriota bacterium]MDE3222186.1 molybdopterin-dependent oxidoreductase [Acidobacteriota bacterium]